MALESVINENKKYELKRPITGVIHKDRIWEQWYPQDIFDKPLPKMNQTDYMFESNKGYEDQVILNNRGFKDVTVREFKNMVDEYSRALIVNGFLPGDKIATISLSTIELIALCYAARKLGIIMTNLNFQDADGERHNSKMYKQINLVEPKAIFILDLFAGGVADVVNDPDFAEIKKIIMPLAKSTPVLNSERFKLQLLKLINASKGKSINNAESLRKFLSTAKSYDTEVQSVYEEGMASNIAFTSATTGESKAVLLSHDANNALAFQHQVADLGLKRGETNLALVPPFLAIWDADIIHMAMCLGIKNILELQLTYENIPGYLEKYKPNYGIWSQYLWDAMLTMPKEKRMAVAENLKMVVIGGEKAEVNQVNRFYEMTGLRQVPGGGATEVDSTFFVANPNCNVLGSGGIPLPFNNVRVRKDGKDLTYNERGRIFLTGPTKMTEYYGRPDLTASKFWIDEEGEKWYDTGDYGYVHPTGSLFMLDRDSDPITINEHQIKAIDIAEMIKKYYGIKICKVDYYKDVLVCHMVLDNWAPESIEELKTGLVDFLNESLPEEYRPHIINLMNDGLPRTPLGKVDYKVLGTLTQEIVEQTNANIDSKRLQFYNPSLKLELHK